MNDESIRQLTAAIILSTYRNHCDAFNKLDKFIEEYNEILDKLKDNIPEDYIRSCDTSDGIGYYEQDKDSWQYKLLDYITKLQTIEQQYSAVLSENAELQQENGRLKEENKRIFSKVNDDELLISNAMNYAEAQDYKSRCKKAIARIKLLGKFDGKYCTRNFKMMSADFNDLLNILQGSDKE